jgi:HemY protein
VIWAFAVLVAVLLGGLLGMWIIRDAGYVLVAYGQTAIETSLWVAVVVLVFLYVTIRGVTVIARRLLQGRTQVLRWRSGRKSTQARHQTIRGMLFMAEGRWEDAKKALLSAVQRADTPLINYLQAARSAHELGQTEERDDLLKLAHESTPGAKFATTLTQAEFQISDGRYEQALAALLMLKKKAPKHKTVLAMLATCYESLADWQALHELLIDLTNGKVVSEAEIRRLSRLVWEYLLSRDENVAGLWKRLPKWLCEDEPLLGRWVDMLIAQGRVDDAEQVLRLALDQFWSEELVKRYGVTRSTDTASQLIVAQGWAKARPNDPDVLVCLGRLSLMCERFVEAREYFDAALRLAPSEEVYGELGRLCVALGDESRGKEYLLRSLGDLPDLPLPSTPVIRSPAVG